MHKHNRRKTAAFMNFSAAGILAMTFASSAAAAGREAYTPVPGAQVILQKYLTMDQEASVPNVTFNYSISAGTAMDSDGSSTLKVFAGNDANAVSGSPEIGTAKFSPGDSTYTNTQKISSDVNTRKQVDGKNDNSDPINLKKGQKYARKNISVDFSNVSFKEPGVYRYEITETASDTSHGITDDSDRTRILDVYVEHGSGDQADQLSITGYVLHNNEDGTSVNRAGDNASKKAEGFVNDYETENLTLSKTVSGNQASRDEYFRFDVDLSNAVEGTVYQVDLTKADAVTGTNAINTSSHNNAPALRKTSIGLECGSLDDQMRFTADPKLGEVNASKAVFYLQGGQSITINGIAKNTAYSISEDAATMNRESYDPSAVISGDTNSGDKVISMNPDTYTVSDGELTEDTSITYTNTKNGIIPTGILMETAPYAAILLGGCTAGILAFHSKWKKNPEDKSDPS